MMTHKPQTPRRLHPHPAPLTGWAKTHKVAVFAARGLVSYTQGCRVQRFRFGCTYVALNVAVNIQQKQGLKAQVQRRNGFSRFSLTYVRVHAHTRAHTRHVYRCTVALLHLYYKVLIKLNILLQHRCNALACSPTKPLHLAITRMHQALALTYLKVGKSLFSLKNCQKPIVYWGFIV